MNMTWAAARRYADKLVGWLEPYCERIEVAGSIRRDRPVCNDVDLVVIPKLKEQVDLFGAVTGRINHLHQFLKDYVESSGERAKWLKGADNSEGDNLILQLPKCQLDVWTASPLNFGTRFLCRTGSMHHNIWLAERARRFGGKWQSYSGVVIGERAFPARTEQDVYAALQLPWIEPALREVEYLRRTFDRQATHNQTPLFSGQ